MPPDEALGERPESSMGRVSRWQELSTFEKIRDKNNRVKLEADLKSVQVCGVLLTHRIINKTADGMS
jgi:hypothetical protein